MTVPLRAALYLRVSTPRQAGHDLSIPDPEAAGRSVVENLAAACHSDLGVGLGCEIRERRNYGTDK
jgi:hypothetical protein